MRLTASIIRAAPTSASRRRGIGVGPACASWPVMVMSYQRWPWAPVTTPIGRPAASRIGPCSMRLEIGLERAAADRLGAGKADALELGTERDAGHVIRPRQRLREIEHPGERPRADHCR